MAWASLSFHWENDGCSHFIEYFSLEETFKIIELGKKADKLLSIQALFRTVRGSAMQKLSKCVTF